jgi:hypothetical protein
MSNVLHLNEDVLERYAMNRLSEAESEAVEDHVAICSHCLDTLDQVTAFVKGMQTALQEGERAKASESKRKNWFQRWLAPGRAWVPVWGGLAMAAAGLLFVVNRPAELGPPAMVTLDGTRGTSTVVHGTGPFEFELFMPAEGKGYHVELLDAGGARLWESDVAGSGGHLRAVVKQRLSTGQYYLHVTEPVSGSQHDYAVQVLK